MKATARLTYQKVRFDVSGKAHLVIGLTAPHVEWERKRPPVCVISVVDVSGSMRGAKLHRANQSVMKLVDHLAPGDFCGVVSFSEEVAVVSPPVEMTQARKEALKVAVGRLEDLGSTNLAGGMLEGLRLANESRLPEGMLVRVILFTDGRANVGVATKSGDLLALLHQSLGRATLSAFGYGEDADQELLRDLSTRGKGNYAFVSGPDDAMTAFARELGGLLSTYAQDIELRVRPVGDHRVTSVLSDVDAEPEGKGAVVRVPDLLADEVRNVVLAVEIAPHAGPTTSPVTAFEVAGRYTAFAEGERLARESFSLEATVERVRPGEEQQKPEPDLDAVVAQAELARAQIDAEELARKGKHVQAVQVLTLLCDDLEVRGHAAVARACKEVAETVAGEAEFERSGAYRASMRKGLGRDAAVMYEGEAMAVLYQMGLGRSTAAQERMAESFKRGEGAGVKPAGRSAGAESSVRRKRSRRW